VNVYSDVGSVIPEAHITINEVVKLQNFFAYKIYEKIQLRTIIE